MADYRLNQDGSVIRTADGAVIPVDMNNRDYAAYQAWVADGGVVDPYVAPAPAEADYIAAAQQMLDSTAQQRNYDGILSACSYGNSTNAQFKAEASACIAWRDAVWTACYTALAAVQGGTMAQPSITDFIASLPKLTWPAGQA